MHFLVFGLVSCFKLTEFGQPFCVSFLLESQKLYASGGQGQFSRLARVKKSQASLYILMLKSISPEIGASYRSTPRDPHHMNLYVEIGVFCNTQVEIGAYSRIPLR